MGGLYALKVTWLSAGIVSGIGVLSSSMLLAVTV